RTAPWRQVLRGRCRCASIVLPGRRGVSVVTLRPVTTATDKPFDGVRVVEVAAWTFVPGAGAIMADLGADVLKIEPPDGDPQRGLMNLLSQAEGGPNPFIEIPNRGKRSVTLDLQTDAGRALLLRLVQTADIFLTSYLPKLRERMRIEVDDLRAVNPRLIYV